MKSSLPLFLAYHYLLIIDLVQVSSAAAALTMMYGVPDSKWSSPKWNWGYASGSGHDCALICRNKFASSDSRRMLIESLMLTDNAQIKSEGSLSFLTTLEEDWLDELKLILGLTWQRGRRDGTDGGPGGYSEVLFNLADCQFETFFACDDGISSQRNFLKDMKARYSLISKTDSDLQYVKDLSEESEDLDHSIRSCAGYVLSSMEFVALGM